MVEPNRRGERRDDRQRTRRVRTARRLRSPGGLKSRVYGAPAVKMGDARAISVVPPPSPGKLTLLEGGM